MLKLNDLIYVDINTREWIHEFRRYGPFIHSLISVERILELLNQGIDVIVPEKWQFDIFTLVVSYNEYARKEKRKTADIAEKRLRELLNREIKKEEETNVNPYRDNDTRQVIVTKKVAKTPKSLLEQGIGVSKGVKRIQKPKLYSMLADANNHPLPYEEESELDNYNLDVGE